MSQSNIKITEEEFEKLQKLYKERQGIPVLSGLINTSSMMDNAQQKVQDYQKELGEKYSYDWQKYGIDDKGYVITIVELEKRQKVLRKLNFKHYADYVIIPYSEYYEHLAKHLTREISGGTHSVYVDEDYVDSKENLKSFEDRLQYYIKNGHNKFVIGLQVNKIQFPKFLVYDFANKKFHKTDEVGLFHLRHNRTTWLQRTKWDFYEKKWKIEFHWRNLKWKCREKIIGFIQLKHVTTKYPELGNNTIEKYNDYYGELSLNQFKKDLEELEKQLRRIREIKK